MERIKKSFTALVEPFWSKNDFDTPLVLVFAFINGLVFINGCLHDPRIEYDASGHLSYILALSELRLVTPADSREFFSPPLPYAFPALLISLGGIKVPLAAKFAQLLNILLSVGLTFYLIKTCQLLSPRLSLKLGSAVFLGILPVYYKTFAFVRGEPYVAFFAIVILYYMVLIFVRKRFTATNTIILGIAMGLSALSRQWGIFLFPAVLLFAGFQWVRYRQWRYPITKSLCLCLLLSFLVGGWFYATLKFRYGSVTAFNRKPMAYFSFNNQPIEFYIGLNPSLLFSNPIRPQFPNQFLPIFYSELWGDYWGYFIVYGKDTRTPVFFNGHRLTQILSEGSRPHWLETNYETIGAYLGRVNLVSIFPSALALAAIVFAAVETLRRNSREVFRTCRREITGFLLLAIAIMIGGYFWFLIMYPNLGKGDTIKASYLLHVYPFVAILVGNLLAYIEKRALFLYRLIVGGLCLVCVHNIAAMVTHYSLYHKLW